MWASLENHYSVYTTHFRNTCVWEDVDAKTSNIKSIEKPKVAPVQYYVAVKQMW